MSKKIWLFLLILFLLTSSIYSQTSSSSINWASKRYVDSTFCAKNAASCIFLGNITFEGDVHIVGDAFNVSVTNYNVTGLMNIDNLYVREDALIEGLLTTNFTALIDGDTGGTDATLIINSDSNKYSCINLTEANNFGFSICNDGSGSNRFVISNFDTGFEYFTIDRDEGTINFYNETIMHGNMTISYMNATGTITAQEINVSYIGSILHNSGFDVRGDPWYFSGANMEFVEGIDVDRNANIDGNVTIGQTLYVEEWINAKNIIAREDITSPNYNNLSINDTGTEIIFSPVNAIGSGFFVDLNASFSGNVNVTGNITADNYFVGNYQLNSSHIIDHYTNGDSHSSKDTNNHIFNRGKTEEITVSLTGGLDVEWTAGEVYDASDFNFVITDAGSGTLTTDQHNYLKYTGSSTLELSTSTSSGNEILVATFSSWNGIINGYREHSLLSTSLADTRRGLRVAFPNRIIYGMSVSEDTDVTNDLDVSMDAGQLVKDGIEVKEPSAIDSRTTPLTRLFRSGGDWTNDTNAEIDTIQYNDGSDLVNIPNHKYVKAVFIFMNGKIGFVYPTAYFTVKADAENAPLPSLPEGLELIPKLTAIVYQQGDTDFDDTIWQDVRPGISEESFAGISDHGALSGLSDDDHTQYLLADGTRPLSDEWDVGNNLTNVSYFNLVNAPVQCSSGYAMVFWNGTVSVCTKVNGTQNSAGWNRSGTNVYLANTNDKVGIGTSTPLNELQVIGNGNFTGNLTVIRNATIGELTVLGKIQTNIISSIDTSLTLNTPDIYIGGTLDFGTNTITDEVMVGNWDFSSYALSGVSTLSLVTADFGVNTLDDGGWTGTFVVDGGLMQALEGFESRYAVPDGYSGGTANYVTDWESTTNCPSSISSIQTNLRMNPDSSATNGDIPQAWTINAIQSYKWSNGGDVTDAGTVRTLFNGDNSYTGTITNFRHFEVSAPLDITNGEITNLYGLDIADMTIGTEKNYAIRTGDGNVSIGGNVSIKGNITMQSTDGSVWNCGVSNSGVFSCN